jgi:hypothetical protein
LVTVLINYSKVFRNNGIFEILERTFIVEKVWM